MAARRETAEKDPVESSMKALKKAFSLWKDGKRDQAKEALGFELSWYALLLSPEFMELALRNPAPWSEFLSFLCLETGRVQSVPGEDLLSRFIYRLEDKANKLFMANEVKKANEVFNAVCQYRYRDFMASHSFKYLNRVNFEITSVCNLHCKYCTFHSGARKSFIDVELYRKLLVELAEKKPNLARLALYMSGESLMHPKFIEILEITKEVKTAYPGFKPLTYLHTNGMLWTPKMHDKIIATGALNQVVWSIDGIDKESFEDMRQGAKYKTVMDNFEYFLKHRPPGLVATVNALVERKHRWRYRASRMAKLFKLADNITESEPKELNEPSPNKAENRWIGSPASFCEYVFHTVTVTTAGQMSLCCVDYNSLNAFGDLAQNSFEDTYFGKAKRAILSKMASGRRAELPGCKQCRVVKCNWNTGAHLKKDFRVELIMKLFERLKKEGLKTLAVFGAGSHSAWLEKKLGKPKLKIKAVLDDAPCGKDPVFGLAPTAAKGFDPKSVDAIVLSTDCFQKQMSSRCHELYGKAVRLIDLYEGLPPGPYNKN